MGVQGGHSDGSYCISYGITYSRHCMIMLVLVLLILLNSPTEGS